MATRYGCDLLEFGYFIKQAREKRGLSIREVELLTTISNPYICQLENGYTMPGIRTCLLLEKAYKLRKYQIIKELTKYINMEIN